MKESIIEIAINQFHQLGIRNVSVDDICSSLRISKKTFYQYFKRKEDLLEVIIQKEHENFINKCSRQGNDKNAIDVMIMNIKEIRRAIEREPMLFWYDLRKYYPSLYTKYYDLQKDIVRTTFEENVRRGIEEGYYRNDIDVEMLSYFHSVQIRHTFESMLENHKTFSLKRIVDFFIDMMVHLITNEKGMRYLEQNYFDKIKK